MLNKTRFIIATASIVAIAASAVLPSFAATSTTGNGAPSGAHYNLNIHGVANPKTADMTGSDGHSIFVSLNGTSKIYLSEGATFNVLDANGTDANGAKFQLPNPDPDNDGTTTYSVLVKPLGKPGGSAKMTTCATYTTAGLDGVLGTADDTSEVLCSLGSVTVTRSKGKTTFTNVSKDLLYIYVDLNGDGVAERYNIFNSALQDYFWSYENNGLKLLQLRFYPIATNVTI
jgi:hypothetical protein